jgi:hypothetical protein
MPQIFPRSANSLSKISIVAGILLAVTSLSVIAGLQRSTYVTQAYSEKEQPVQFSHKHHVGDDGIDCRYCHTTVEIAASAGIPPTKTCMNCHTQIWADSPYLEPVRESWRTGIPIKWNRVHDLPDFVYFNHSIHVNKGVGCSTCHGNVADMPAIYQVASLQMEWCLECHRQPEKYLREQKDIFDMKWKERTTAQELEKGKDLKKQYKILPVDTMTACSTCHR